MFRVQLLVVIKPLVLIAKYHKDLNTMLSTSFTGYVKMFDPIEPESNSDSEDTDLNLLT